MTTPTGAATPGPWRVYENDARYPGIEAEGLSIVVFGNEGDEHDAGVQGKTKAEAEANAHLIAAASEMQSALQADLDWWAFEEAGCPYPEGMSRDTQGGEAVWGKWYDECRAMCARAREQQRAALAAARGEVKK